MVGIYKIINKLNGKIYIGKSVDIEKRVRDHLKRNHDESINGKHGALDRDIQKYGAENFTWEVISQCREDQLNTYESAFIVMLDACNPEKGYNKQTFSTVEANNQGKPIIDIDSKQIYASTGSCARELGISQGDITRVCNRLSGSINGRRFMYLDEYTEKGIVQYQAIENHGQSKNVKCVETEEVFESAHEAGRKMNLNFRLISSVCNGKRKTTGGYHFIYI